jgi:hypothetical protein
LRIQELTSAMPTMASVPMRIRHEDVVEIAMLSEVSRHAAPTLFAASDPPQVSSNFCEPATLNCSAASVAPREPRRIP